MGHLPPSECRRFSPTERNDQRLPLVIDDDLDRLDLVTLHCAESKSHRWHLVGLSSSIFSLTLSISSQPEYFFSRHYV